MKGKKTILAFALIGIVESSIILHELIHYFQFKGNVTEFCAFGLVNNTPILGWVRSWAEPSFTVIGSVEPLSYLIQFGFTAIVFWIIMTKLEKLKGEAE